MKHGGAPTVFDWPYCLISTAGCSKPRRSGGSIPPKGLLFVPHPADDRGPSRAWKAKIPQRLTGVGPSYGKGVLSTCRVVCPRTEYVSMGRFRPGLPAHKLKNNLSHGVWGAVRFGILALQNLLAPRRQDVPVLLRDHGHRLTLRPGRNGCLYLAAMG